MSRIRYFHVLILAGVIAIGFWLTRWETRQPQQPPQPFLRSELTHAPINQSTGPRSARWKLEGYGLREISVRLVAYADGGPNGTMDCGYHFTTPCGQLSGELLFVIQDGSAFGQAGKYAPWLSLTMDPGSSHRFWQGTGQPLFTSPIPASKLTSFCSASGEAPGSHILFEETLGGQHLQFLSLGDLEEELKKASSDKRVVYVIVLEWK